MYGLLFAYIIAIPQSAPLLFAVSIFIALIIAIMNSR